MKILQRNLKRSTFVVWEMKRNVSVVRLIVATRSSGPPAEIQSFFGDRVVSKGLWPPRSPDLTSPDYFLWGYLKRRVYQKNTNHRSLESKHHRRNSGNDSGRTGKNFPKYCAPGSILSGRKWWPLPAHVMMSSHFLHNGGKSASNFVAISSLVVKLLKKCRVR